MACRSRKLAAGRAELGVCMIVYNALRVGDPSMEEGARAAALAFDETRREECGVR